MKQLDAPYRMTTMITTRNLTDLEIITKKKVVIIMIMYVEIIFSKQVNGIVLGAGEKIMPTDNSVSGVNYPEKSRGEENPRNSIHQLTCLLYTSRCV